MADKQPPRWVNKTPLVGWHPPQDLVDWLNTEAASIGTRGARSEILTAALRAYAIANGHDPQQHADSIEDLKAALR